jgi:hypothetical protein
MILRLLNLVILACLAITALAHRIEIDPGQKQCFFETLQPQDKVRQVKSGLHPFHHLAKGLG